MNQPQLTKALDIVRFAAASTPYYSELFRSLDVKIEDIKADPRLFASIPLLTKEICQENDQRMIALQGIDPSDVRIDWTSGTTGIPLTTVKTNHEYWLSERTVWRARVAWDKELLQATHARVLSDYTVPSGLEKEESNRHLKIAMARGKESICMFEELSLALQRHKSQLISGVTNTMITFARLIDEGRVSELGYVPLLIEVVGDHLLAEEKSLLNSVFGCPVADFYACREVHGIAYACPRGTLHILEDNVLFETLPINEREGLSEVVVTGLSFKTMPFIRYQLGDLVEPLQHPCQCGSSRQPIRISAGRTVDLVPGHHGIIASHAFPSLIQGISVRTGSSIKQFKIVQNEIDNFRLILAVERCFSSRVEECLRKELSDLLDGANIEIEYLDVIPRDVSSRNNLFVSEVYEY